MRRLQNERISKTTNGQSQQKPRLKRKQTKEIVKGIQKRYYRDPKHLREKYKNKKARHPMSEDTIINLLAGGTLLFAIVLSILIRNTKAHKVLTFIFYLNKIKRMD